MPDEIDQAQEYNEDFQAFALEQNREGREPANYTGTVCLECGKEIPVDRRKAQPHCRRCIGCQEEFELAQLHDHWRAL